MTKRVKQQLIDIFISLNEEEEWLLKNFFNSSEIQEKLINMQQLVIESGTLIEKIDGEGIPIIHLLEDYCELLWEFSIKKTYESALQIYENIKKVHILIEHALHQEIVTKKEIVFFPYKASMWDSLESVWETAKDNPELEVFVVPIPYFDKNSDGSFHEMHYEGGDYPSYVPITNWQEYKHELRLPDVAFIHNPYDGANNITSVHPSYYTKELKTVVSQVVYIPYFVYGDNIYENYCINPGTIYADKVILQSDSVRAVYIRCFSKWVHDNKLEPLFAEETIKNKFLALGSPKIDKVVHSKKEDYELPKCWRDKLSGKKAVLYNTGMNGILSGNEQYIKKLEDVISCFRNRNDVILWWRPHPLNKGTYNSMRPQLLDKYNKIIENFIQEDHGIYDNTTDLHRALNYTDIYYGDDSSLVHLCGVQGKPIMMQNIQELLESSREKDKSVYFYDCACENDVIWFVAGCYNALYQMDIVSGKIVYLGKIPGEYDAAGMLYENIIKVNDNLWMIPAKAKEIACFNLSKQEFIKISLEEECVSKSEKFRGSHIHNDKIYMIPWKHNGIICVDTVTHSLSKIDGVSEVRGSCLVEDSIYMPVNNTNIIQEYRINTGELKEYHIGDGVYCFSNILFHNNKFWMIPRGLDGEIVCWDKKRSKIHKYNNYPKEFKHTLMFRVALCHGEFLWLYPEMGNMIICMNVNNGAMKGINISNNQYYCSFVKGLSDGFLTTVAVGAHNTTLIKVNYNGDIIFEKKCIIEEKPYINVGNVLDLNNNANYKTAQEYIMWENPEVNLKSMLDGMNYDNLLQQDEKNKYYEMFCNIETKSAITIMENVLKSVGS